MERSIIEVDSRHLSEDQKEAFERVFLENSGTVEWQGERYYVTAMDQSYPEASDEEEIEVSFSLKPVDASEEQGNRV